MNPRPVLPVVATVVADLLLVLLFAAIGRASHDEDASALGFVITAWPFVAGLVVGWIAVAIANASRAGRALPLLVAGLIVWFCTVAVGLVLRAVSGQGIAVSFVIVTAIVLAVFLLGWRAIALLVRRLRAR